MIIAKRPRNAIISQKKNPNIIYDCDENYKTKLESEFLNDVQCPDSYKRHGFQSPSITKKMTILFFVYFGMHNNKIHTIYKQARVFVFIFSMLLFCFY
jgi:hypothetical protein